MKATIPIESFPFSGAAVRMQSSGRASLLQGDARKEHLRGLHDGHLLGAFPFSSAEDLHADLWEMHPAGDEALLLITGALGVEILDGALRSTSSFEAGHGMVMPRGTWHRFVFREPGLLVTLSPRQGTRLSRDPGGAS